MKKTVKQMNNEQSIDKIVVGLENIIYCYVNKWENNPRIREGREMIKEGVIEILHSTKES